MWETLGHISIRIFMKICELAKHRITFTYHVSWKFVHGLKSYGNTLMNMKTIKSLMGCRKQIIVKCVLGNWLQTCQLIWLCVTYRRLWCWRLLDDRMVNENHILPSHYIRLFYFGCTSSLFYFSSTEVPNLCSAELRAPRALPRGSAAAPGK